MSVILLTFAETSEQTLTQISDRVDMPRSTVFRLIKDLEAGGVLQREDDRRYRISDQLRFAGRAEPATDQDFETWVVPTLENLCSTTGLDARAGFLDAGEVVYVEKRSTCGPARPSRSTKRLPAHATALGKALLAFSPGWTVAAVVNRGLKQYTPRTIVQADHLRRTLRSIRLRRMASCVGEFDPSWFALAVPVTGADGWALAALELRLRNAARDLPVARAVLTITAAMLASRDDDVDEE